MKELKVLLYGEQTNTPVLKMPGRRFPGILLQGDTLKNLLNTSEEIANLARQQGNSELIDEAEELTEMLSVIYQWYVHETERIDLSKSIKTDEK